MKDIDVQSFSWVEVAEEPARDNSPQGTISMNTVTSSVNDFTQKMGQTKELEEKMKAHDKTIEKLAMEMKKLELKVFMLEWKAGEKIQEKRMNIYDLEEQKIKISYCACKARDNFHCL